MKSKEVLNLLKITRPTLTKYVKTGVILVVKKINGQYDYDKDSVYNVFNKGIDRKICIYGRVSAYRQINELNKQIENLKQFCFINGWIVNEVYSDITSGISFENRKELFKLLDEVIDGKVKKVVIYSEDRLTRVGFKLFENLFDKFNTELFIMSEPSNKILDFEEVSEIITNVLYIRDCDKQNKILSILEDKSIDEDS